MLSRVGIPPPKQPERSCAQITIRDDGLSIALRANEAAWKFGVLAARVDGSYFCARSSSMMPSSAEMTSSRSTLPLLNFSWRLYALVGAL